MKALYPCLRWVEVVVELVVEIVVLRVDSDLAMFLKVDWAVGRAAHRKTVFGGAFIVLLALAADAEGERQHRKQRIEAHLDCGNRISVDIDPDRALLRVSRPEPGDAAWSFRLH